MDTLMGESLIVDNQQRCFMTQLEKLLNYVKQSSEGDELTATVFRLAADSAMLKSYQRKEALAEIENAPTSNAPEQKKKAVSTTLQFKMKEIAKMSKTFKKEFIANGLVAHVIKRESGKRGFFYEIRYRRNGYNIAVSHKDLQRAKEKFIEATHMMIGTPNTNAQGRRTFGYLLSEMIKVKKGTIEPRTLEMYESNSRRFIPKHIMQMQINQIQVGDIADLMKDLTPRLYEELRTIFNQTFKYAIASGVMLHNPIALIPYKKAERENRESLTTEQVEKFLQNIKRPEFDKVRQVAYILYFFGLRPCEVDKDARFEGDFLICRNRKRKNKKVAYKKIPIPNQAHGLIDFSAPIVPKLSQRIWCKHIKEAINGKASNGDELTAYNLRHTFASICGDYVSAQIVAMWMGDNPEELVEKVYIHHSDDKMRAEMDKVVFVC